MREHLIALLVLGLLLLSFAGYAQDSSFYEKLYNLPDKLFSRLSKQADNLNHKLDHQTTKYLARLQRREEKIRQQLWKKDSIAAKTIFGNVSSHYTEMQRNVSTAQHVYSGRLDSIQTALRFLQGHGENQHLNGPQDFIDKYQSTLQSYGRLQENINQAERINKYLKARQLYLKSHLEKLGLAKQFKKFQKDVYYYRGQVAEYKRMLDDPSKLAAHLLQLASKLPAFRDFFAKHSMLGSLFRLPSNNSVASGATIPGLQTRASVQALVQQRFGNGTNISHAMQQNMQTAQTQIDALKDKIARLGGGSSDMDIPDFKPNSQKVKSFWNRIELGINVQSAKSTNYFPVTSDLALSAGYRLNDKSTAGVGISYKMGWGENIRHIKITHEGVGLRSFFEWRLKGNFYTTGGFEYNYQKPFNDVRRLHASDDWQRSGLIGLSKNVSIKSSLFKTTKIQLLWDFLSYQQMPRTQALKFRVGYNFK
jgi:hypothetical protein